MNVCTGLLTSRERPILSHGRTKGHTPIERQPLLGGTNRLLTNDHGYADSARLPRHRSIVLVIHLHLPRGAAPKAMANWQWPFGRIDHGKAPAHFVAEAPLAHPFIAIACASRVTLQQRPVRQIAVMGVVT